MNFGLCDILVLIFIILRLCNIIDWAWYWIISPYWIYYFLVLLSGAIKAIFDWFK